MAVVNLNGDSKKNSSKFASKIDLKSNFNNNKSNATFTNLKKEPASNYVSNVNNKSSQNSVQIPNYSNSQNGMSELMSALAAQQQWYADQLKAQQAAQQQAAQNAYNSNMSALQEAYQKRLSGLDSNLASTKSQLTDSYNNSSKSLNDNATKALQEAYISRMMNEKNLPNQLSVNGINGGASESAIASMLNNYGNARNNIETAKNNSLSQLEQAYNSNMANALQSYNDAVSSAADTNMAYRMQLENDLANNTVSSYANLYNALANMDGNYVNAMSNYIENQADRNASLQAALQKQILANQLKGTVSVDGSNASSAQGTTAGVTRAQQLINAGYSFEDAVNQLENEGYSREIIAQLFSQLNAYSN